MVISDVAGGELDGVELDFGDVAGFVAEDGEDGAGVAVLLRWSLKAF